MNEQCPRCNSYKTEKSNKFIIFLSLFATGGCLIWVGFLFPLIWIIAALLILVSPLGFLVPKMTTCNDCKYSWKKGEADKYKKAIEDIKNNTD